MALKGFYPRGYFVAGWPSPQRAEQPPLIGRTLVFGAAFIPSQVTDFYRNEFEASNLAQPFIDSASGDAIVTWEGMALRIEAGGPSRNPQVDSGDIGLASGDLYDVSLRLIDTNAPDDTVMVWFGNDAPGIAPSHFPKGFMMAGFPAPRPLPGSVLLNGMGNFGIFRMVASSSSFQLRLVDVDAGTFAVFDTILIARGN